MAGREEDWGLSPESPQYLGVRKKRQRHDQRKPLVPGETMEGGHSEGQGGLGIWYWVNHTSSLLSLSMDPIAVSQQHSHVVP